MDANGLTWPVICALSVTCAAGCEQPASGVPDENRIVPSATVDAPELELDYKAFDQTPDRGWRKRLIDEGDFLGTAKLIDTYVEQRKDDLKDSQRRNLRFHAGQLYAFADNNATALSRLKDSIDPSEPEDSQVRWNAYVKATIAFLEKDHEQLVKMRDTLAETPHPQGQMLNLDVVERLIHNFDTPYSTAYTVQQGVSSEENAELTNR